jgi:arginine decarboxylase
VGELGSLLDHSGPIGESEKYAARVFGAQRSYTVTNGTSTSNRVIMMSSVTRGDYVLCDRNAHKSIEQALTLTGAIPTYLLPTRNFLGIIGPIHPERLTPKAIKASIAENPLAQDKAQKAVHAIITNSTYDGLTYLVPRVVELLDKSIDRIHFDEAWYGYARFNPIYQDRFGMYGDPKDYPKDKPTIFTTTSTHKLLAALSQASLINVRDGRKPVEHARFNEAFMMHASTSPQYAIITSNEFRRR